MDRLHDHKDTKSSLELTAHEHIVFQSTEESVSLDKTAPSCILVSGHCPHQCKESSLF